MKRLTKVFAVTVTVLGAAALLSAQEPLDLQKMGAAVRVNQEELRTYSWQSRVTYLVNGVQRKMEVFKVEYGENDWMQRTQIGGETAKGTVKGPDGKKLSKKQQEAALEFVAKAKNQLDAYFSPLFTEKAVATATATVEGEDLVLLSQNVVNKGDTVTFTMSNATRAPKTLNVSAVIEGSPMQLDVTFGVLEWGPFYPAKSVTATSWNGMQLQITTENSDYSDN
jgi:hypothetical protein